MNREVVASELLKVARELIAKEVVFVVKQGNYTLWIAYSPGSGHTTPMSHIKGHITDNSSDKNFNSDAKVLAKKFPANKVIPLPIYDYVSDQSQYSVFGGPMKPMKQMYIVIKKDNDIVVHFFDKKGEASYWAKN